MTVTYVFALLGVYTWAKPDLSKENTLLFNQGKHKQFIMHKEESNKREYKKREHAIKQTDETERKNNWMSSVMR